MIIRLVALTTCALGVVALLVLAELGHPVVGAIAFAAAACASLVTSVVAFVREPDKWPDDVRRFPPD